MYYISEDTFDQLPEDLKDRALADTRKYYKNNDMDLPEEISDGEKKAEGEDEKPEAKKSEAEAFGKKKSEGQGFLGEDRDETPKTWDDAHNKGMSLIIAVGKPKKGEDRKKENDMDE